MRGPSQAAEPLGRGEFVRVAYRLGRAAATGVLTVHVPRARPEVLVLRRGHLITSEGDALGREAAARLAKLAALEGASWLFDGGTHAYPPGAVGRQLALVRWVRGHLEAQLDATRAERLVAELAGVRLSVRAGEAPDPTTCDETDRRILAAMSVPRRLDQIWPLARTPRFRLLAFIHFLRSVGALAAVGIASERATGSGPHAIDPRAAALRVLGVVGDGDRDELKRAYRRLARALHPDLHPAATDERRRELERKLAQVTAAYAQLTP